ncbi:methyltransferase type 11 [Methylobacterium sp. M6A4_1b]
MHIDVLTIVKNVIVMIGWSKEEIPELYYNGSPILAIYLRTQRIDLSAAFGEQALHWGFTASAILQQPNVDASKLSVRLSNGRLANPIEFSSQSARQNQIVLQRFLEETRQNPGPLLEIGSRARSGNSYRSLFPEACEYTGLDITAGPNVDIVGDAHELRKHIDKNFRYIFSISVFEHLLMPWKVAIEMNGVMHDGGFAYIQSHHGWPLHEEPWDFWRFSSNSWNGLFNEHTGFEVIASGYDLSAMVIPDINFGGPLQNLDHQRTFLLSSCLVRKIGPATVQWNSDVSQIYDLEYNHS